MVIERRESIRHLHASAHEYRSRGPFFANREVAPSLQNYPNDAANTLLLILWADPALVPIASN